MRYKILIAICILSFSSCLFQACQSGDRRDSDKITIVALKGPSALCILEMMEQINEVNNIPVNYEILSEPSQVRARMLTGEAQIAMVPTNMAAILYNMDVPYRLAMVPVWGTLYVCGSNTGIASLEDLRGKRVYSMARGLNPDIIFRYLLDYHNIQPDIDLAVDYSFPGHLDLANAVKANRADLAVLSEPQLSLVLKENPSIKVLIDLNKEWASIFNSGIPQTAVMVQNSWVEESYDNYQVIRKALEHSVTRAESAISETAGLGVKYGIFQDEEALLAAIPRCHIHAVSGESLSASLESYLRVFYNFKPESIGGKIPDEDFIIKK